MNAIVINEENKTRTMSFIWNVIVYWNALVVAGVFAYQYCLRTSVPSQQDFVHLGLPSSSDHCPWDDERPFWSQKVSFSFPTTSRLRFFLSFSVSYSWITPWSGISVYAPWCWDPGQMALRSSCPCPYCLCYLPISSVFTNAITAFCIPYINVPWFQCRVSAHRLRPTLCLSVHQCASIL